MKRLVALICAISICVCFVGCDKKEVYREYSDYTPELAERFDEVAFCDGLIALAIFDEYRAGIIDSDSLAETLQSLEIGMPDNLRSTSQIVYIFVKALRKSLDSNDEAEILKARNALAEFLLQERID